MKVLFINPPRENELVGNNPSIIEEERGFNPPLGILYVAAYLEKYSKHEIAIIDAQVEQLSYENLSNRIKDFNADVVGITAMTFTLIDVIKTAEIVKNINSSALVVLGGPHVHLFPDETINLKNIDFLVLGEGEETFTDLLNVIENGIDPFYTKGIVYKKNDTIINTGIRPPIENLDSLPFPARHLIPYKKYSSLLTKGDIVTTIFTSRGCPFSCSFCDRPNLGKKFRARSAKNVVDELEECYKMGIKDFLFYDDTFTVNAKRVIDICDEIIKRKLDIFWDIRSRVDTINEQIMISLKKAGCQGIHYGVEAGTQKILDVLKKGITIKKANEIFKLTKKHKMMVLAYFMIGSPEENKEDIFETFKVMKYLNPDFVHLTILTPFPGTQIYKTGLEKKIIKNDVWKEFAKNPSLSFTPPNWGEFFTREELNGLLIKGYKSFYLRIPYILKRLLKVGSFSELKKKAKAGLNIFKMPTCNKN